MQKIKSLILCALALTLMGFQTKKREKANTVTMASLLKEMTDRTDITYYPSQDFDCRQFSSHDRRSDTNPGNHLWFANNDFGNFIREEQTNGQTEYVLFDHQGPGSIVRFWMTGNKETTDNFILRFYIDGNKEPAIEGNVLDIISRGKLVGPPLSTSVSTDSYPSFKRGHNLYLPIPYGSSCKITAVHKQGRKPRFFFYNINYRAYRDGVKVESFNKNTLTQNKILIEQVSAKLKNGTGEHSRVTDEKSFSLALKAGQTKQLAYNKGAAIQRLGVQLKAKDMEQALRSTVVKMTFDGEQTVWCPVGEFFGIGHKPVPTKTRYHRVDADGYMSALWVMPFQKNCRISFENLGEQPVEIHGDIALQKYKWTRRSMHFYACWKQYANIKTGDNKDASGKGGPRDLNYVRLEGKGVYAGDVLCLYNPALEGHWKTWWGEGDEKIYVDGEKMPSHFGTGSEDYFGYAWGLGTPFHHPFIAQPIGEGNLTTGVTVNSRVRALDKIPFRKSLKFDMELWHWVKTSVNYAPATFFYMLPNGKCLDQPQVAEAKRKVARKRHDIIQPVADKNDIIEGESMICSHKEAKFSGSYSGNFSGGYLMRCFGIKENLTLSFHASEVQTTDLELKAIIHPQAGVFNVYLNKQLISSIGSLPKKKSMQTIRLKQAKIQKGENKLVFKFKENPSNNKEIDIDYIKILPTSKKSL